MKRLVNKIFNKRHVTDKYEAEIRFWKNELFNYVSWYNGDIEKHYETSSPKETEKCHAFNLEHSAILTWLELHQKPKYLVDLQLPTDIFKGKKILDIGSGPLPSAEVFEKCELYCLDPLLPSYIKSGFPIHLYGEKTKFVYGYGENIPFENDFFDGVVSINSIDHVDNIYATAEEITRVLKPNGMLRIHAHYHAKTPTEPLELNDEIMKKAFHGCANFTKIHESTCKLGAVAFPGESFTLWSSF